MGFLSSIKSVASKAVSTVKSVATTVSKAIATNVKNDPIISKPKAGTTTFSQSIGVGSVSASVAKAVAPVAKAIGGTVAKATVSVAKSVGSTVVKAVASLSPKTKVLSVIGAGVLAPSIAVVTKEAVTNPKPLVNAYLSQADFTKDAIGLGGQLVSDKSVSEKVEDVKAFVGEHPIGTVVVAGGALVSSAFVGGKVAGGLMPYLLTKAVLDNDDVVVNTGGDNSSDKESKDDVLVKDDGKVKDTEKPIVTKTETPMEKLPATMPVTKTSLTKRKRKKQAKTPPSQSMRVNIYNQSKVLNTHCIRR